MNRQVQFWKRCYSTTKRGFREVKIPVPWGHISGKWWDPSDQRPILALHGWQDSAGTFDRLVPLMTEKTGVLAVDLPGHGHSSRIPPGMYYHFMNNVIMIKLIAEHFQWPKLTLMGHSLGAIACSVYNMIFPGEVDFLLCIDGFKPLHMEKNIPRAAVGIQELLKYDALARKTDEPPSYSWEELVQKVSVPNDNSINPKYAHHIMERNVAQSKKDPNKYYFTRDPRLKSRLIINWPHSDLLQGAARIKNPVYIVKFKGSGYYENKKYSYEVIDEVKKASADCQYLYVDGMHHTVLNAPEVFADSLNAFIEKHDVEDRTKDTVII